MVWPCLEGSHAQRGQRGLTSENQTAGEAVLARKGDGTLQPLLLACQPLYPVPTTPISGQRVVI